MRRALSLGAGALLLGLFVLQGCSSPRQTVPVSQRPPAVTDTLPAPTDTVARTVPLPTGYDTVEVQRFDRGKVWPLDQVPEEYFESTYDVEPTEEWLGRVRSSALRFGDGCSGSFVSSAGLVMTNHHCAREAISNVQGFGKKLLEEGFYADSLGGERPVPGLHVDQLVTSEDVTDRVEKGLEVTGDARAQDRQQRVEMLEETMTQEVKKKDERLQVEVVGRYHGAQYQAYTYRRYEDVRLVMAPELQMGYFGGEADNFTYPRFSLDIAFFRVYGTEGNPLESDSHFSFAPEGSEPGEPVFAVGNPGSTSRHDVVSQLEYKRDYRLPDQLAVFRKQQRILGSYIVEHPETAVKYGLRNTFFSLGNSIKSLEGRLHGLQDPYLLARRGQALRALGDSMATLDTFSRAEQILGEIEQMQKSKQILASKERAFLTLASVELGSRILTRGIYGYYYDFLTTRGARPDRTADIRTEAERIVDWPAELEEALIVGHLEEIRSAYGADHPTVQRLLRKRSPQELARHLVEESALKDSAKYSGLLEEGYLKSDDVSVPVMEALAPLFLNTNRQMEDIRSTERNLSRRLSKARRAVYGAEVPPDATFTLRLSDGVVRGYQYNGTVAPPYTNYYGLYDRYYSHNRDDWSLPEKWVTPPDSFDLATPLNLASTNDIAGGSSGSPLLNRDLEVVGVVFDSNMEALPNEYVYRTTSARAISVDVRGILEALEHIYATERLIQELTSSDASVAGAQTTTDRGS